MALFEILPGPVQNNMELAGIIVLVRFDVGRVQVMAGAATGKFITGTDKSCGTLMVCETGQPVIG